MTPRTCAVNLRVLGYSYSFFTFDYSFRNMRKHVWIERFHNCVTINGNYRLNAWFPLDRNGIVKSCIPSKFYLTVQRFARIYDKNILGCKSEPISVRFLLLIVMNLSTISQNLLESHYFTILLRSNGNQA